MATKTKAAMNHSSKPYLFEQFNVIPYYTMGLSANALIRISKKLVEAFNEAHHLPKYIIILPDKDLIEAVHFGGFRCKFIFEHIIN